MQCKVFLVLGHTGRGSVSETIKAMRLGTNADEVSMCAARAHVIRTMDFLLQQSHTIREKVAAGDIEVHGAVFDTDTGKITFLDELSTQDSSGKAWPQSPRRTLRTPSRPPRRRKCQFVLRAVPKPSARRAMRGYR
jgi:carbonic anhydrase